MLLWVAGSEAELCRFVWGILINDLSGERVARRLVMGEQWSKVQCYCHRTGRESGDLDERKAVVGEQYSFSAGNLKVEQRMTPAPVI